MSSEQKLNIAEGILSVIYRIQQEKLDALIRKRQIEDELAEIEVRLTRFADAYERETGEKVEVRLPGIIGRPWDGKNGHGELVKG